MKMLLIPHDVSSIGACRPRIFFINGFLCFFEDEWQRNGEGISTDKYLMCIQRSVRCLSNYLEKCMWCVQAPKEKLDTAKTCQTRCPPHVQAVWVLETCPTRGHGIHRKCLCFLVWKQLLNAIVLLLLSSTDWSLLID